mmetsp:Transcript_27496/g.51883  ORF Transcript_27496/g.51883 Transcript_27496/m.51883 type:complete len:110 (+) Transcript_27496:212-541(+)
MSKESPGRTLCAPDIGDRVMVLSEGVRDSHEVADTVRIPEKCEAADFAAAGTLAVTCGHTGEVAQKCAEARRLAGKLRCRTEWRLRRRSAEVLLKVVDASQVALNRFFI